MRSLLACACLLLASGCLDLPSLPERADVDDSTASDVSNDVAISDGGHRDASGGATDGGADGGGGDAGSAALLQPAQRRLALGKSHVCALDLAGNASCWGHNESWQASGEETTGVVWVPAPVVSGTKFHSLSAGRAHTCGLTVDRKVVCWGQDDARQVSGVGGGASLKPPVELELGPNLEEIETGDDHNCVRDTFGKVTCWGLNVRGQTGTAISPSEPFSIPLAQFTDLALGRDVSCGLWNGGVHCWGVKMGCSSGSCDLATPAEVSGYEDVTGIDIGVYHGCLTRPGGAECWGSETEVDGGTDTDRLGFGPGDESETPGSVDVMVATIVAGWDHTVAIDSDGKLWGWGLDREGELGQDEPGVVGVAELFPTFDVKEVDLGRSITCFVDTMDAIWCAGSNTLGELGQGRVMATSEPLQVDLPE